MFLANKKISDISNLRHLIWGEVVTPYDDGWDDARGAFNLTVDQQPAAIVYAESAGDVQATVRFARRNGLQIAPQTTGHNAGPLTPALADTILLKTTRMKGVEIDAPNRVARVQAGTVWSEVTTKLEGTGLAALHGSSGTVGVVGYSLTGGLGWQARKHGLQTNHVTAIELVNEFGELIRASKDVHPDLFWALRGAGGNFGVVTAIEFELIHTPQVNAGMLIWDWTRAAEVLDVWRDMLPDLPEEFTSTYRIMQLPPFEEIPEPIRGRQLVVVNGAVLGDRDLADKLIAPLRALDPELDTFDEVDASALSYLHMDPQEPLPYTTDHMLLDEITDETAAALIAAAGPGSSSPLAVVELRHLGGALTRVKPGHGARATLEAAYAYFGIGALPPDLPVEVVESQLTRVREVLEAGRAGRDYLNFSERPGELSGFFDDRTYDRIKAIKAEYDQSDLFKGNFAV